MDQQCLRQLHAPVMVTRICSLLGESLVTEKPWYVDATLGMGGHAEAILEAHPNAQLLGIDRDPEALAIAESRLASFGERVHLVQSEYRHVRDILDDRGIKANAMLADLGLSSLQIDHSDRGFSYAVDAPLDMRMNPADELSAADIINTWDEPQIAQILHRYGEEKFARRIAAAICREREVEPFTTSKRLVAVIDNAIPRAAKYTGGHSAKRTFQALRIVVNDELAGLAEFLPAALESLALHGQLAVLSYHSGEDRLVKQAFQAAYRDRAPRGLPVVPPELQAQFAAVVNKAELPTQEEIESNPRAKSAKLRVARRIKEAM